LECEHTPIEVGNYEVVLVFDFGNQTFEHQLVAIKGIANEGEEEKAYIQNYSHQNQFSNEHSLFLTSDDARGVARKNFKNKMAKFQKKNNNNRKPKVETNENKIEKTEGSDVEHKNKKAKLEQQHQVEPQQPKLPEQQQPQQQQPQRPDQQEPEQPEQEEEIEISPFENPLYFDLLTEEVTNPTQREETPIPNQKTILFWRIEPARDAPKKIALLCSSNESEEDEISCSSSSSPPDSPSQGRRALLSTSREESSSSTCPPNNLFWINSVPQNNSTLLTESQSKNVKVVDLIQPEEVSQISNAFSYVEKSNKVHCISINSQCSRPKTMKCPEPGCHTKCTFEDSYNFVRCNTCHLEFKPMITRTIN